MIRPFLALMLLPVLVACVPTQPPPPPPRVVRSRLPAPPPPPPPDPQAAVPGRWSFSIANGVCSATLANPVMRLAVAAGPRARLNLTARGAVAPSRVEFASSAGPWNGPTWHWSLQSAGSLAGTSAAQAGLALDEAEQGRLRDLLSGGTLRFIGRDSEPLLLSVPDAGISGRDWFGCVAQSAERRESASPAAPARDSAAPTDVAPATQPPVSSGTAG